MIALIALFAAIGGGAAIALPGKKVIDKNDLKKNVIASKNVINDGLTGDDIKEGTLDIPAAALPAGAGSTFGVTVSSGGAVQTTTLPGVTVSPGGGGLYTLTFPRSLGGCVPVASDGSGGSLANALRASVANGNQVFIGTSDGTNTEFSLIVTCPS